MAEGRFVKRMPGMASAMDIGKNAWAALNGNPFKAYHMKSIGGALTAFGGVIPGAVAGAALGSATESPEGALIGAGVGAAAGLVAAPLAGLGIQAAGSLAIGTAGLAWGLADKIPGAAIGAAKLGLGMVNGSASSGLMSTLMSPVRRHANALYNFGNSLVRFDKEASNISGVKFTGVFSGAKKGFMEGESILGKIGKGARGAIVNGATVLAAATVIEGATGAFKEINRIHMGTSDGQVTRATPRIPAYQMNAGATGDLVFALNRNKRG